MTLEQQISIAVCDALKALYNIDTEVEKIQLQKTKKEFEGDITVLVFPFVKLARKSPDAVCEELGAHIVANNTLITKYNSIKGFLNLSINSNQWLDTLSTIDANTTFGTQTPGSNGKTMMVEYSSPNTNKPLHLGHIRNNLLGDSIARIQKANGWNVIKTNIVNDRGIHICKSMLAWVKFGNGETPESAALKGDHLVGKYYVEFDKAYKAEIKQLIEAGADEETAKKEAPLMIQAQEMLVKWEQNDPEVRSLWAKMNQWVYDGFDTTYKKMGVDFDKIYYESNTYLEGKEKVEEGLAKGVFYRRPDGSVWADLAENGLDEKLLLRADGTSVYMTQDIGTAKLRYQDYSIDKMVYVVGNEQNYHFQVLSILLDRLGFEWGKDLVHFSYGMVELPEGKMKSREGTVVDADDLMAEMQQTAMETSRELGKLDGFTAYEIEENSRKIGLGALKYFILKVDPRKNMTFNPKESIDFNGNTGPFIQYTNARINSILRKANEMNINISELNNEIEIADNEVSLIQALANFPNILSQAGKDFNPALLANYSYDLVKEYNTYYQSTPMLKEENTDLRNFRIVLSRNVGKIITISMSLLGIEMPEKM